MNCCLVFHVLCFVLFCFIRWVGAWLKPRNLVLGADGAAGAGGAGTALVGAGAGAAGAGAAPPSPLVKATCGSVYVCLCRYVIVCVYTRTCWCEQVK